MATLKARFNNAAAGEGHCIFINGEAGIGKTSLVKAFCKHHKNDSTIYKGMCDALFTPRPLAPFYDIALQVSNNAGWLKNESITDRPLLFANFFRELNTRQGPVIIVFEDIHWADEATIDFIKFFARRISQTSCLFLLTSRNDEIHNNHPLKHLPGQLSPDTFTRLQLTPFSREAVEKMAAEKGYKGEDVYSISGGNPFYVNEILASYSPGIPDNIKDSILSVYNSQQNNTKHIWQIISIVPAGLEIGYLKKLIPGYTEDLEQSLEAAIIILNNNTLLFKHELYRRTIEASISPLNMIALNKKILDLLLEDFEQTRQTQRIIHHAKNANENDIIVRYAPLGAKQAATAGAHIEAAKLYLTAIEYYKGNDANLLIQLYERYAYECYLTNQIKEAIVYTKYALKLWEDKNDIEKVGSSLRFLSRLSWFEGDRKNADYYGYQAIETLDAQPSSKAKAMAYSNMSQLKMLSNEAAECRHWGEKAITIGKELNDEEVLSHAYNNVGTTEVINGDEAKGMILLGQSLSIALKNSYQEHAARAYTNIGDNNLVTKHYAQARKYLDEGIKYCEELDLDSWSSYMLGCKARLLLETGQWDDAVKIAQRLISNERQANIIKIGALAIIATVDIRKGTGNVLAALQQANELAFASKELQRIIIVLAAFLEYEWITGKKFVPEADIATATALMPKTGNLYVNSQFTFWLYKARHQQPTLVNIYEAYDVSTAAKAIKAANLWEEKGCAYMQGLALFEGSVDDKKKAIAIIQATGATATVVSMKGDMRAAGIKSIPRGARQTTQANAAQLTERELGVLQLLHKGMQNKEIAATLFISPKTVDHHISNILFKLDATTRAKAVQQAIRLKIV